MLTIKKINTPAKGTIEILIKRLQSDELGNKLRNNGLASVGMIQGPLVLIIAAGDVAEKASNVEVAEITGICPQHMAMVGVFGDISAVAVALKAVENWEQNGYTSGDESSLL
jgi:ethanolamine utilization microcompartment shell protein EutS